MNPHPHAEVLRAIADGVPLSEFEASWCGGAWQKPINLDWFWEPDSWKIRRKPQYIMVNGFKVPKPLDGLKMHECYFLVSPEHEDFQEDYDWEDGLEDRRWLERGLIHSTPESAAAHAKAMLGIDPEYFK